MQKATALFNGKGLDEDLSKKIIDVVYAFALAFIPICIFYFSTFSIFILNNPISFYFYFYFYSLIYSNELLV